MQDVVVFIAGGTWQRPLISYLKDKGHYVAVVNPVVTTTTRLADLHIEADVNDLATINSHLERLKPRFITSDQSDISVRTVASLSTHWGLPGNGLTVTNRFCDKHVCYRFATEVGVPVPKTRLAESAGHVREFAELHGRPVIIKPTDATMSRGVRKFESPDDVTDEAYLQSRSFSKSGRVIVQEFVEGDMVTMEGVCSGHKHRTLATSKKDGYFRPGINTGVRYPSSVPAETLDKLVRANDAYVEASGLKFGLTHSEYIIDGDNFWLIEIGCRGGGAGITDKITPWVSGVNVYDILYASLCGEAVPVKELTVMKRPALLKYYRKEDVPNCDHDRAAEIRRLKGVADFQYDFIGQQYVSDSNDIRHSMAIYLGETEDDVTETEERVRSMV